MCPYRLEVRTVVTDLYGRREEGRDFSPYNFSRFAQRRPAKTTLCTALSGEYLPWRRSAV
jgi:hypothetical protein